MKRILLIGLTFVCASVYAQEFVALPSWEWTEDNTPHFIFKNKVADILSFTDERNPTYSPDSSKLAYTLDNDLYVRDLVTGEDKRLTFDGSELILNGYASWVYYEEIFGRPSKYRAFWWSPDSKKIGFYRFDNSSVPMFPIYSPFGQDGSLSRTRYPKAGESNPKVSIGIADVLDGNITWAQFDENEDQYFGTPFWNPESDGFYISREPRVQNALELFKVDVSDGSKTLVYSEKYDTWVEWIDEVIFTERGLFMARSFETGWEQIYFLSYDGLIFRRLSSGPNWRIHLLKVDTENKFIYYTANRDSDVNQTLYRLDFYGFLTRLTDPDYTVSDVSFSPDGQYFMAVRSNYSTPKELVLGSTDGAYENSVLTSAGPDFDASKYALPQIIHLNIEGLEVPGYIVYPKGFDPSRKYPVHIELYGGPNTAYVRGRWIMPDEDNQWWSENGIIHMVIDSRVSGHNGRAGTDLSYKDLVSAPISDFVAWAKWLRSLPYVDGSRIGVEGFSFGGTNTALLLIDHSDLFCCGIAGGGVYDWQLYDSHYTERFMTTPELNPSGYAQSCVLNHVANSPKKLALKLTHGTGDDNVHFQNTLQLIDAFQKAGVQFELMIYPDGMHGYRGYQNRHSVASDHDFWKKYLLD